MITAEVLKENGFQLSTWVYGGRYQLMGWKLDDDGDMRKVYVNAVYNTLSGDLGQVRATEQHAIVGYEGHIGALRSKLGTVEDLERWIQVTVPQYCIYMF
jgi:hypothetical protein